MSPAPAPATNVFDAAKAIVEKLEGLDKQLQVQAIRFASESLGLGTTPLGQTPPPPPPPPGSTPPGSGGQTHSTDIKQFTTSKAPKSDQQFAAVVAYFYRFEAPETARKETIDSKTLVEAARLVGRNRPRVPSVTLANAKNAGYLDPADRGQYKISAVGENLVAVTLPGNASEGQPRRGGRKKTTGKKKTKGKRRTKRGE